MEEFLLRLDLGKTCLLGSSSTVQLVTAPTLPPQWANPTLEPLVLTLKQLWAGLYGGSSNGGRDAPWMTGPLGYSDWGFAQILIAYLMLSVKLQFLVLDLQIFPPSIQSKEHRPKEKMTRNYCSFTWAHEKSSVPYWLGHCKPWK